MQPFERLVTRHGTVVLRVCRALAGPQDAEDAWSETFLAALRAYPRLPPDANVEAWLVTIAQRKAIDILRAKRRRAQPVDPVPDRPTATPDPGERHDLWRALESLTERQRTAVVLHHIAGLPYAHVAAITGGTPEAARRAVADGLAALRAGPLLKADHR